MGCTFTESRARNVSIDSSFIRKYSRSFIAVTDHRDYGPSYVRAQLSAQLGITPGILSVYQTVGAHPESDSGAQVLGITVTETSSDGLQWLVAVEYGPWNPATMGDNPLNFPPTLTVEGQNFQEITDVDISGNPLVNTAGDPYDPGIAVDRQRCTIRISQNLQTFPSFAFAYTDYLNSQPFAGLDAKLVKLAPPQVTREFHPNCGTYYSCAFLFDHNPLGWQASPLNQGFRQLVSGVQVNLVDKNGQNITSPLPLSSSGTVLAIPATSGTIITNHYDVYKTVDFNSTFSFGAIP